MLELEPTNWSSTFILLWLFVSSYLYCYSYLFPHSLYTKKKRCQLCVLWWCHWTSKLIVYNNEVDSVIVKSDIEQFNPNQQELVNEKNIFNCTLNYKRLSRKSYHNWIFVQYKLAISFKCNKPFNGYVFLLLFPFVKYLNSSFDFSDVKRNHLSIIYDRTKKN